MTKFIFNIKTDNFVGSTASGRRQSKLFVLDLKLSKNKHFFQGLGEKFQPRFHDRF